MKFLLDMGLSPRTAEFLRRIGYEASHLSDDNLNRLPDPDVLAKARRAGAVLLAHDLDFADLLAASGAKLPSVVLFRLRSMRPDNVDRHLGLVLEHHSEELRKGAILTVTEGRIRARLLPIGGR